MELTLLHLVRPHLRFFVVLNLGLFVNRDVSSRDLEVEDYHANQTNDDHVDIESVIL